MLPTSWKGRHLVAMLTTWLAQLAEAGLVVPMVGILSLVPGCLYAGQGHGEWPLAGRGV